jgi:glycine/D-amino acid oxidase-like deaminating enzyme
MSKPDVLVIGAGAMGAWTAFHAGRSGLATTLVDAYGAGHPRATSGDETRHIRSSHGPDEFYARWSRASLKEWTDFADEWDVELFVECGVVWFAERTDGFEAASETTLGRLGIPTERLAPDEIERRWPGVRADGLAFALFEPEAGILRARQGIQSTVEAFICEGGGYEIAAVRPGRVKGRRLQSVEDQGGVGRSAEQFVFACGPWLPRLFPDVLGDVIRVTKQDVLFFGTPGGDERFAPERFPAWVEYDAGFYGIPTIDERGVKAGPDRAGPAFDPSHGERFVDPDSARLVRTYLARRLPDLADQPIVETRVCQYESTIDTHFVIDRHPAFDNVWLVGGGSGHGFKHGPMIGRAVASRLRGEAPGPGEERFSIGAPRTVQLGMRLGGGRATEPPRY